MNISQFVELAKRVHDAERMNFGNGSTREGRNKDWARIVGIAHHGHPTHNPTPDPQWCLKDAGGGRPQSDESVAILSSRLSYDCIVSNGADGYWFNTNASGEVLGPEQNIYPPPVPDGGGGQPAPVPVSDIWTATHQALRAQMPTANTQAIAEQLAFSFPGERWGQKRADPGRPVSGDVIALLHGSHLYGVRVIPVTAGAPFDITGQTFVAVTPIDHIGGQPTPAPVEPTPVPPPPPAPLLAQITELLAPFSAAIVAQSALIEALRSEQSAIHEQLANGFDIDAKAPYLGKITGTVKPKPRE